MTTLGGVGKHPASVSGPENPDTSEKNSASCEEPASDQHTPAGRFAGSSASAAPVLSVLPLQAVGTAQRDARECAPCDVDEPSTMCHTAGIEEEIATSVWCDDASGVVSSLQLETRGITSQKEKVFQKELWARQTIHKNTVAAKLRELGRLDLAEGLESCHTDTTWCICKGCNASRPFLNRCEKFFCPECQPTLSRDRERSVGWWARETQQPKHVVLTLVNEDNLTKEYVQWAKDCYTRLRRRVFAKNWIGGFYNWEVTKEKAGSMKNGHVLAGGWHLHCHSLVEARFIDMFQLSEQWQEVTGGKGRIVNVRDARQHDYLKEVTKYAVKGNQLAAWTGAEIAMFIDAFQGVRTFGVFGSLYGKRTEFREWIKSVCDTALKCKCGCTDFWYQTDFDYQHGELIPNAAARPPTVVADAQRCFAI